MKRTCRECTADISDRHINAVSCRACLKKRRAAKERRRYRDDPEGMAARKRELRRDPARHARELQRQTLRRVSAIMNSTPAYRRKLAQDRVRNRPPARVFFHCPDGSNFDKWLEQINASPPPPLPDLTHVPDAWRPFVCPDYLK